MKREQKSLGNKGFSLVELIIVIAIMAILIAVLAPQYLKYVERSRKSTDVSNVAEIVTALQTWGAETDAGSIVNADWGTAGDARTLFKSGDTGTVVISGTSGTKITASTAALKSALDNAGINAATNLKSANWNKTDVTLDVKVNADLSVTVTDHDATATLDIVKGIYTNN